MSSLSATQADGYYLPPEYYESGQYKKKSKNQFAKSKGHNQYLQKGVVRFELPYKGICKKCQQSIGRGTRYNAQKTKCGSYFTTTIWEFAMTCRNCQHPWTIRTNPQQRGFDYVEGITIQAGQEDSSELVAATTVPPKEAALSSLQRMESIATGKRKARTEMEELQQLQELNQATTLNDSRVNATIRKRFRIDRNDKKARLKHATKIGWAEGMEMLAPTITDAVEAKQTIFGKPKQEERKKLQSVRKSSIFSAPKRKRRPRQGNSFLAEEPFPDAPVSSNRQVLPSPAVQSSQPPVLTSSFSTAHRAKKKIQLSRLSSSRMKPQSQSSLGDFLAGYASSDSDEDAS